MSDTEIIPKPHQLVADHSGVMRWSPLFDSIRIEPGPQGGKRISVTIKSDNTVFDLTEDQVSHFVALLVSPSSAENASLVS